MSETNFYIVAKVFDRVGCLCYKCKSLNEARCIPGTLEAIRNENVQIVILDSPEIYMEYEPYNYVDDLKEFIKKVGELKS